MVLHQCHFCVVVESIYDCVYFSCQHRTSVFSRAKIATFVRFSKVGLSGFVRISRIYHQIYVPLKQTCDIVRQRPEATASECTFLVIEDVLPEGVSFQDLHIGSEADHNAPRTILRGNHRPEFDCLKLRHLKVRLGLFLQSLHQRFPDKFPRRGSIE